MSTMGRRNAGFTAIKSMVTVAAMRVVTVAALLPLQLLESGGWK